MEMSDIGLRDRVEATMCMTFGSAFPEGREEARISREDWESLMCTLRLALHNPGHNLTPTVKQALRETLGEN
jgi:hypothetical protein